MGLSTDAFDRGIIERIGELHEVGVTTVSMTTYTLVDRPGMIREVGSKVIAQLRN